MIHVYMGDPFITFSNLVHVLGRMDRVVMSKFETGILREYFM